MIGLELVEFDRNNRIMAEQPQISPSLGPDALDAIRNLSTKAAGLTQPPDDEALRQRKIDELRAKDQAELDRIEQMAPDLDELLSTMVQPPREWLDER